MVDGFVAVSLPNLYSDSVALLKARPAPKQAVVVALGFQSVDVEFR
jgi:hypothetical protein